VSVKVSELENKLEAASPAREPVRVGDLHVLPEEHFQRMVCLERKRAERSGKPFLLMLLDTGRVSAEGRNAKVLQSVFSALALSTRDTDITGWYKDNSVVGVMFTEIAVDLKKSILGTMLVRVSSALRDCLTLEQFSQINISFHLFPEEWGEETPTHPQDSALYPDLRREDGRRRVARGFKRAMDVVGALAAVIVFSPLFLLIAAAVKFTSKGPVFFRQPRIGQFGRRFTFLKFRSMYVNNSSEIHKEYVRKLIAGKADQKGRDGVFKITDDPRVTPVGRILRRTSLDELPQFINVLLGEMSLVGPRPPVPYEVEAYDVWHRRRLLEARPGITGLWQVNGRSRTKFDDMVRLDLQYARKQSLWLDVKILLRTPAAVVSGDGAY
jgi:lipopolysaccharide/colanic/teichoic acid biosynthesis glycosyltransferase